MGYSKVSDDNKAKARIIMKMRIILSLGVIAGLIFVVCPFIRFNPAAAGDPNANLTPSLETAIFAGGCFWCMEAPFDKLDGVISTTSGYTGGHKPNPTYKQVLAGGTGHTEAVRVVYDPEIISYSKLLSVFWRNIDPTVNDRQFCDIGSQYRPAIFYGGEKQRSLSVASKVALGAKKLFKEPIVTEIVMATTFYPAEEYHQDYYKKNPARYKLYRFGCGRDKRLKALWG